MMYDGTETRTVGSFFFFFLLLFSLLFWSLQWLGGCDMFWELAKRERDIGSGTWSTRSGMVGGFESLTLPRHLSNLGRTCI